MLRDIDYAALAVRKQIGEKFGRQHDLGELEVLASETTIVVQDGEQRIADTRDNLLAAVRRAKKYHDLYESPASPE